MYVQRPVVQSCFFILKEPSIIGWWGRTAIFQELQATFNKYKLKNKVKFDQLRKEVTAYCSDHGYSINDKEVSRTSFPARDNCYLLQGKTMLNIPLQDFLITE